MCYETICRDESGTNMNAGEEKRTFRVLAFKAIFILTFHELHKYFDIVDIVFLLILAISVVDCHWNKMRLTFAVCKSTYLRWMAFPLAASVFIVHTACEQRNELKKKNGSDAGKRNMFLKCVARVTDLEWTKPHERDAHVKYKCEFSRRFCMCNIFGYWNCPSEAMTCDHLSSYLWIPIRMNSSPFLTTHFFTLANRCPKRVSCMDWNK